MKQFLDINGVQTLINNLPGQGMTNNGNKLGLNDTFYSYLLKQTFATPTVSTFTLSGTNTSGSKVVGTTVTLTGITHKETNIDNISGNLTLSRNTAAGVSGTTLSSSITKSSSNSSVSISDTFTATNNGTVTYTLSAPYKDTTGASKTASKTASITFYWPIYKFASGSTTPSVSDQTYTAASSVKEEQTINTTSTTPHVHFITTETISNITSGGFAVPFSSGTLSVTINGCTKTYNTYSILNCQAGSNIFVLA